MKALLSLLLLSSCFIAQAELIWSNRSSGGNDYLIGTVHLGDERFNQLPERIKSAIDAVDVVVLELDLSLLSPEEQQHISFKHGLLPEGKSLASELSPEVYSQVQQYLSHLGYDIKPFERFKPWMLGIVMVELTYKAQGLFSTKGIDLQIKAYAESKGKKIVPLESFEQQMMFFDKIISDNDHINGNDVIKDTLNELATYKDLPHEMMSAWLTGNMAMFDKVYNQTFSNTEFDRMAEKVLLTDRNKDWQNHLDPLIKEKKVLVAVGSLHFAGPHNLLKLLEDKFVQE